MQVQLITTWDAFRLLAGEWNGLLERSRSDSLFLRWEWLESWASVFAAAVQPFVLALRDRGGSLAGLAPHYRTGYRLLSRVPVRGLRFLADEGGGAEYGDWIVSREVEHAGGASLAGALSDLRKEWDFIWMRNVSGWAGAFERIARACHSAGLPCRSRSRDFSSFRLPGTMEEYLASLTANRRSQFNRQARQVLSRDGVAVRRCSQPGEVPRFLDDLFELHTRRWAAAGASGSFARKPGTVAFYRAFVPIALERGWLRMYALEERGSVKAVQIGYVYKNVFHQVQEGYDPAYFPGVGNVLRLHVIERCIEEGVGEYDFLGEMTEHKRRWAARPRHGADVLVTSRSPAGRMLGRLPLWPSGRFLRPERPAVLGTGGG